MIAKNFDAIENYTNSVISSLFAGPDKSTLDTLFSSTKFGPILIKFFEQDKNLNKTIINTVTNTKRFRERIFAQLLYEGILCDRSQSLILMSESDKDLSERIYKIFEAILLDEMEKEKQRIYYLYTESEYTRDQKTKKEQLSKEKDKIKGKGGIELISLIVRVADLIIKVIENFKDKTQNSSPLVAAV